MYLHIHSLDKFTEPYIQFINSSYDINQHQFVILLKKKDRRYGNQYPNVLYVSNFSEFIKLILKMNISERIYFHGLTGMKKVMLLFFQPWILAKSNWILWGADLYSYRKPKKNIKQKIHEFARKYVIRNINEILPIVEGDYHLAKKWYRTKAKYRYNAIYVTNLSAINNGNFTEVYENTNEFRFLIGNSADPSNNHKDILFKLSKFKDENIKLYVPLSYGGGSGYIEEITKLGYQLFGEKFIPLTKFMKNTEYIRLLSTMNVGIFNNDRQQAMGNIYLLFYLGKKVFIRNDTTMWNELEQHYYLRSVEEIENESLEFICSLRESERKHNMEEASLRYDIHKVKAHWQKIFSN